MDDFKETRKTKAISRFFDRDPIRTNPFGANQAAHRAYRRAERLVAAIYLVTNHILPQEPLKSAIRSEAILILKEVLSLRDDMRATDSSHANSCRASIRHLISLINTLSVAGFLSTQNSNTVIDGLDDLANFIEVSRGSSLSENFPLKREDFLDIDHVPIKDIKDSNIIKDTSRTKNVQGLSDNKPPIGSLSVREHGILGVLRVGGDLAIGDIASNLPEYSEKMIQRDLLVLVGAGHVKKVGLKRWSRYSI